MCARERESERVKQTVHQVSVSFFSSLFSCSCRRKRPTYYYAYEMGKRKRVAHSKSLDEMDRTMYKTFSSAANAVSLLYTQV